jgi:hypothetical protein
MQAQDHRAHSKEEAMHPVMMEALLVERVREVHAAADASRRAKLARQTRRGYPVSTATATGPVAALRSLSTAARAHTPVRHTAGHAPRRAA